MDLAALGNEIKVAIRVRPLLPKEQVAGIKSRWQCTDKMITPDNSQSSTASYVFDRVFDEGASNKMVYDELASDIVKQAMIGFNGTLFTYGQSGSGKTYTIDALRAFAIKSAYDYIENCPAREFLMRVSYIELYNEKLTDLLSDGSTTLTIREDYDRNVYIDGLQEIIVKSQDHVKDVLTQGNARRTFAETRLNDRSSRAHCIFRLVIESREREDPEHSSVYVSYLNLVDLAGSEKAGENSGERLREGVSINLSLLTLSQVIRKLSGEQREFINYRDSKLTRILQNALEGNSKTAILCTVAPFSVEETHSTLRFALNAKKVKTKPQQNEVLTDSAMLKKSQLEITKLKNKIKELEERNLVQDNDELQRRRAEREHLIKEFSSFLCVSSKAREEKRGFDKKRRETVCVPQMFRSADFKVPGIPVDIPKLGFSNPQPKLLDSFCIPESPPANDSVFAVSHSLDSPCSSPECSYCDLSFTGFEQAIVQDSVLQKYKAKLKKYEAEIADLNRKLKKRSGLFVTSRSDRKARNKSFGLGFLNPTLCEVDEEETFVNDEDHMNGGNERLDENVENMFEGNETLKSQNNVYKNEIEGLKNELEALTVKMTQSDEQREEYAKYVAKLSDRIKRDEEIIKELKAREEEMALQYEEKSKRWQEKVEKLEWERSMQEMMKEEKGLLETSSIDKNEASEREAHDDLEMQKKELLNEWEEVGRLKEELNEQAISIEKTLGTMEKEKERLQKERERIDREWNELEKANDDLRKEKEDFDQQQENEESSTERLLAVQETASPHLRIDLYRKAVMLENDMCVTSEMEDVMSGSHVSSPAVGRYPENITLSEEKEALLRELNSLRQIVSELNARKCAIESEMANSNRSKYESNEECLPEKADMPGSDRLKEEWEILRKAQKQLKDREIELSEQEAASERIHDRCCMLEELNERLEEEVQKWRRSQHDHETLNVTIHEGNALSMLNNLGVGLHAESCDGKRTVEYDSELVRQERLLQEEYKKLTKYQAELSKQEENVERKIERLCMLEEEKEELEAEKERFYREKESLREAEMDLMKAKEDLKQERLKVYQELDTDRQGNTLNRNQVMKEEEKLHESWGHLRKVQEQFQEEKEEALEQAKTEDEAREILTRDQEALNREWDILRQAQNDFRREKEALEISNVNMKRRTLRGRGDTVSGDRLQDNLSQLDDESGIVTATSWDNSSLCCELKDRSENMSVYIHDKEGQELQEKIEDCQEQRKHTKNAENGMQVETSENGGERNVKCLVAGENSHSFDGKLTRQGNMETIELVEDIGKEQVLRNEEDRYAPYTIDKLQTLHDEVRKLELEKEQLFNEKAMLQTEKEQFQEMIDTLQRENKILKGEISENSDERDVRCLVACVDSHSFEGKLTRQGITDKIVQVDNVQEELGLPSDEGRYAHYTVDKLQTLHDELGKLELEKEQLFNEKVILQTEKEQFQEMIDTLQRENKMLQGEIENSDERDKKYLVPCVDSDSFEGKLTRQGITDKMVQVDNVQEELRLCSDEGRYAHYTVDKLQTLHHEMEKLELENKQLFNEKAVFQTEKEQFQEMIDTLQRENKMLKGEISASGGESDVKCLMTYEDSHSFDGKLTRPGNMDKIGQVEDVQKEVELESEDERCLLFTTDKQQTLHNEMEKLEFENKQLFNEKVILQTEKEQFQEMIDTLQRENKMLKGAKEDPHVDIESHQEACLEKPHLSIPLNEYENNIETCVLKERNREFQNECENLKVNGKDFEGELFLLPYRGKSLKEENQRLQKQIENLKQCQECLRQNRLLPIDPENMETQDMEQMVKTEPCVRDIGVQNTSISVQNKLGGFRLKDQNLEPADLNELEFLDETVRIQTSLSQSDISRYIDVSCNGESNAEVCDLMTELKTAGFFTYEKKDTFGEEKESLEEEWEKLKQAQKHLCSKEAALRDLEKDFIQRSDILHKFEAEQRLLQQSTDHLKQTEDILSRQQEELKVLEDNIKIELTRLLALQKEKEIIQIEIEKLIEDKMILEKVKGKVLEQQEMGQEKSADSHGDNRRCENGTDVTEEEKNILRTEEEFVKETKTTIQENLERCHQKNCMDPGKDAMFSAQQEHLHNEEELEMKKASLQNEEERLQKEQEMLEDMKAFLQEEAEKLKTDKEMINEKAAVVQEEHARLQREQEIFERQKTDLFEEHKRLKEDLDKRQAMHQEEKETHKEQLEVLHEEQALLQKEKDLFKDRNVDFKEQRERLEKEKEIIEQNIVLVHEQEKRLQKEKEMLEKAFSTFQKEQDEFQIKTQMFEENNTALQERQYRLHKEKEMFEYENIALQNEKERFQKEKELFEEKYILFQEEQRILQIEKATLQESVTNLQLQQARYQNETEIVQEEKDRLQKEKDRLQEEKDRLQEEKDRLNEKIAGLQQQEARYQIETEIVQEEKDRLQKEKGKLQEEKDRLQEEKDILNEKITHLQQQQARYQNEKEILQEEKDRLQKEKDRLQEEKDRLQEEKDRLNEKIAGLQQQEARYQIETEIVQEEKDRLQKEKGRLQEEKDRLQEEKDILNEKITDLQQQQARYQNEKEILQEEKDRLQKEKDRLQEEKDRLNEKIAGLQQQEVRYQIETEIVQEERDRLQKEKGRLQEEKDRLQEEKDRLQEEKDRLNEKITDLQQQQARYQNEKEILQEEKDRLQEEKDRLQEAEVNLLKKWDSFQMTNDDIAKYREQLNEKEKVIENKFKHLSSFEKEKERFQTEWAKLEKACEDLKHEKVLLNERIVLHEKEKMKLQEEWDNVQQCREDLKQDNILFLEKKKNLQEELQSAWDNLRQAQDKVAKEEEAVSKKYAEIEKMQAVLEHERTLNDKDAGCAEDLMAELQKVEVELDNAYDKIDRLENLITKGKVMLAEKTEAVRQANDKVKELEEAVDGLKSNLASLSSLLETKSNECEKLKKVHDSYRKAAREHEGLKKEMEAMVRGRTKDRECYEDTIRQLKLKLRDTQSAETSFFIQRDPPNQCAPTLDQMRKIVEFENAAKFLELKELREGVQEQKAKIADLEKEKSLLQAEIKKVQLLLENEAVKSEAMKSTANQAILARRKVEEEIVQLRKQLGNGGKQKTGETSDEVTKSLRTQLQEKDQLIDQLTKSIDSKNMRWNAVALRHKTLIEENHSLQKLVMEHQYKSVDSAKSQAQCNVSKDSDDSMNSEKQTPLTELMKENSELKASVEKLKLEFQQQTVHKENHLNPQQRQSSRSAESLPCVHSELSMQTENSYISQQPQQTQTFSAPSCRSGGVVESFVIAVKDREIRDLKRKLEKQSEALKQVEQNTQASTQKSVRSEVKQQPEEPGHRRFQINNTDKENIPFGI